MAAEAEREVARERAGRAESEAAALRDALGHERGQVAQAREAQQAAEVELAQWVAGGPLARAVRAFLSRRGRP
jgi:hypothetical protein